MSDHTARLYRPSPEQVQKEYVPPPLPSGYQPREEAPITLTGPQYYKVPPKPGISPLTEQDGQRARRQTRPPRKVEQITSRARPRPGSWAEGCLKNLRRERRWMRAREVCAGTPCPSKKVAQVLQPWIETGRVETLLTEAGGMWLWFRYVPGPGKTAPKRPRRGRT